MMVDTSRGIRLRQDDPHIWLDPVRAKTQASNIATALAVIDPVNKDFYQSNCNTLAQAFDELDSEYRKTLNKVTRKEFVVSHAAFGYLSERYNLIQMPIMGISGEAEPTPAKMAEITRFCQQHAVRYIFFEELVSPKTAQVLARDLGVEALVLNPLGSLTAEQLAGGQDYFSLMRENLHNLHQALE
jgi:zinc transport system substrate-binding protein